MLQPGKSIEKNIGLLIFFLCLYNFSSANNSRNFFGLATGRDLSGLYYFNFNGELNFNKLSFSTAANIFQPIKIQEVKEDYLAYQMGEFLEVNKFDYSLGLKYGDGIVFGTGVLIRYYGVKPIGIEWYEIYQFFSIFFSTSYGNFSFSYNSDGSFTGLYDKPFIYRKIKFFPGISLKVDKNYLFTLRCDISTYQEDFIICLSYSYGYIYPTAFPLSLGIVKKYGVFEITVDFIPSDLMDNSFRVGFKYYM